MGGCGCKKKVQQSTTSSPVTVTITETNNTQTASTPIDQQVDAILKKIDEIKNNTTEE